MDSSPALLAVLLGLATLNVLLLLFSLLGGVVLLGWGSRLAMKAAGPTMAKGLWPVAFLLLPGAAQLLFSVTRPTPPRFRLLALGVTVSLTATVLVTTLLLVLMTAAGIPIGTQR